MSLEELPDFHSRAFVHPRYSWAGYGSDCYVHMGWKNTWKEGDEARAESQIEFFKSLPGDFQKHIFWCGKCTEGECARRKLVETKDGAYPMCIDGWWRFPPTLDAIAYILEALRI